MFKVVHFHPVDKGLHRAGSADGIALIFLRFDPYRQQLGKLPLLRAAAFFFLKFQQCGNIRLILRIRRNHFWRDNPVQRVFLDPIRNYRPLRRALVCYFLASVLANITAAPEANES